MDNVSVCWRIPKELADWIRQESVRNDRKITATVERILREAKRKDDMARRKGTPQKEQGRQAQETKTPVRPVLSTYGR